jgi:hypothetical protein
MTHPSRHLTPLDNPQNRLPWRAPVSLTTASFASNRLARRTSNPNSNVWAPWKSSRRVRALAVLPIVEAVRAGKSAVADTKQDSTPNLPPLNASALETPARATGSLHGLGVTDRHGVLGDIAGTITRSDIAVEITQGRIAHLPTGAPVWQNSVEAGQSRTELILHTEPNRHFLTVACQGAGSFAVDDHRIDVDWQEAGTGPAHYLLGLGFGIALERLGVPALHGGAVEADGQAIALIGGSQSGKTTLALEMVAQGASLLTEDLIALHQSADGTFQVFPGPSEVRLWPDSAEHLATRVALDDLARVHERFDKRRLALRTANNSRNPLNAQPLNAHQSNAHPSGAHQLGAHQLGAHPLRAIVVVHASDTETRPALTRLRPLDAIVALLRNGILGGATPHVTRESQRLEILADCVNTVGVYALNQPHRYDLLSRSARLVLNTASE